MAYKNEKRPGYWSVYDDNAREFILNTETVIPRNHQPIIGYSYPLTFNLPCFMPEAHARILLKDVAFRVYDENDVFVPSLSVEAQLRSIPANGLADDQVIATLHELTNESLLTRACMHQGGRNFDRLTPRDDLIDFLIDGGRVATQPERRAIGTAADGDLEEMGEDEAAAMAAKVLEGA